MKKELLDRKFIHHSWFVKQGVTRKFAMDYFAKSCDFSLAQKPAKKQSNNLLADIIYDDVITDGHCTYRLSCEEKKYYLERKEYWNKQKKIESEKWLSSKIDFNTELKIYLSGNGNYDIEYAKRELSYCDNDEFDRINFWKNKIKTVEIRRKIINNIIEATKDKVKTNKDFIEFKQKIENAIDNAG